MDFMSAIDVFVEGFTLGKSKVHPYLVTRYKNLWIMRDAEGRKEPRVTEVVACHEDPDEIARQIREFGLKWHFLSLIHPFDADFDAIRSTVKGHGYRAKSTEGFFVHQMHEIPTFTSLPEVRPILSTSIPATKNWVKTYPPESHTYGVWEDDGTEALGWVQSTPVRDASWISNLYVREEYRKQGYGRALMSKMLLDDRERGVKTSVLLASTAGGRLYPHLGYDRIGTLQLFCPIHKD